jgi:tetratricopeptide (TPR) repeat protein
LHRDLKPANVLLAPAGISPPSSQPDVLPLTAYVPQIADFGMAKFLVESNAPRTVTGVIRGTPAYMAPEQAAGQHRDITTAVDVYALGAILYELLVRRPPFHGDTPLAILDKVRSELPTPPRAIRHELPTDLETVCLKSMDKAPARRYRSAEALAADLERVLLGEPIRARRSGRFERVRRSLRRHPAVTSLSLLLVLTLIAGLVVTWRQLQHTRWERNRAEHHLAQLLDANEQTAITTINDFESRAEEMGTLRHKLMSESAERFAQLASQLSDDPGEQLLRGRCYLHLAVLYFNLGKTDESRTASLRAVESYGAHARNNPKDPNAVYGVAAALMRQALTEHNDLVRNQTAERAHDAFAKYLALPEHIRRPRLDRESGFATFQYDLSVVECSRGNRDRARQLLAAACERLRILCAPDSPGHHQVRLLLARFLSFRCQIERFGGQPHVAIEAGSESQAIAKDAVRERPDDHMAWLALASAHNEFGLALEQGGKRKQAIDIWRDGYERLGHADVVRSTRGLAGTVARLRYYRLMIAHNLALGYGKQNNAVEYEQWCRTGVELARPLLFVMPNNWQLWYIHGMCCANLVDLGRYRDLSPDRMSLQFEGLASRETALRIKPDDHKFRSNLGWSWHLYAIELSKLRQDAGALVAFGRAMAHQAHVVAAMPKEQSCRDRLKLHIVRFFELVVRHQFIGRTHVDAQAD